MFSLFLMWQVSNPSSLPTEVPVGDLRWSKARVAWDLSLQMKAGMNDAAVEWMHTRDLWRRRDLHSPGWMMRGVLRGGPKVMGRDYQFCIFLFITSLATTKRLPECAVSVKLGLECLLEQIRISM